MTGFLDAHVHVWDTDELSYGWTRGTELDRPMLPSDYARAGGSATAAVFVQAADDHVDPVVEARWVDGLDWPELVGIVAAADLRAPRDHVQAQLVALAAIPRVVGVRHLLQDVPTGEFGEFATGLGILAGAGGTFDACVRHGQLTALRALLDAAPQLVVVLDHLGKPPVDEGIRSRAGRAWIADLAGLSRRPRTYIKLSGLTPESRDPASFERYADAFLACALEAFGTERAMIASDWPVSERMGVGGTAADWFDRVRRLTPPEGWADVSGGTALRAYLPNGAPGWRAVPASP